MDIKDKINQDLELFLTTEDPGGRGLSDHMLFYMNIYPLIGKYKKYRTILLNKVRRLVTEYNNRHTTDLMGMIFFELYYNTLRRLCKYKLKEKCKVFTNISYTNTNKREFIKLYHSFGIYWAQHTNLVNPVIKQKCEELGYDDFVVLMDILKREIYENKKDISWTHNHYAYFSTLFFTQPEPTILRINKQKYTKFIKKSLMISYSQKYSIDYIGECVEHLLRYNKKVPKYVIEYIINYKSKDNSYHYLVCGSLVPLLLY